MVNATALVNFGNGTGLEIGDWTYSTYLRSAPDYLPLNNSTTSYLQASYPALAALLPGAYKLDASASNPNLPSSAQWNAIAFGNGTWVAQSQSSSAVATSPDGITWTARTSTMGGASSMAYGAGLFVAIQGGGTAIATSPDGITWTNRTGAIAAASVFFLNGQFVSGGNGVMQTSPDGITWTARTVSAGGWFNITYGAGLYVAFSNDTVSYANYITSPDGITWTTRTSPLGFYTLAGAAFGNGTFVLMPWNAGSGIVLVSTDGLSWSTLTGRGTPNLSRSIAFGNGVFIVEDSGTSYLATDGTIWKTLSDGNANSSSKMVHGASGVFVGLIPGTSTTATRRIVASVGTTTFTLPVVTPVTGTFTYIRAT